MISAGVDSGSGQAGRKFDSSVSKRYLTTVRIAFRAKQRRFDDFDGLLGNPASSRCNAPSSSSVTSRTSPICSRLSRFDSAGGARLAVGAGPVRGPFCVLVDGQDWAFELTLEEWDALSDVVLTLVDQHRVG